VGLSKLSQHNKIRQDNAEQLAELLADQKILKVHLGRDDEQAVYYALLIEVVGQITDLDSRLQHLQNLGIPIRKTWEALHVHPHFNPDHKEPSRGLPWKHAEYDGQMKDKSYSQLNLPITKEYCPNKILELYVHPPTGIREITFASRNIKAIFGL
jgi:dTDP-4-amino-4,6-dideoxygalactose transaminase